MALTPGTRIGPYEVIDALGAGGMGEVYKARDPRLDRIVAIKVLPSNRADDPERQQRFDREARAVAALSHPNICAIYDVGHADGTAYLVMEYLDGETLADRLAAGGRSGTADRRSRASGSDHASGGTTAGRPSVASPCNWRRRWPLRTTRGSFIAISSPPTSSSFDRAVAARASRR
jgi:serine/threonine protein kinase